MFALSRKLSVPQRYSNRFSSNPFPLNGLQFYADLWHYDQKGYGTLTNGTGIATPTSLSAGDNTVTNTQAGTFTIWLPDKHTGTAASGTATVTGSPVSLVGGNNTITVTGTGTITVTCTDQVVDRSINALLGTVTGATWGSQGRTFASGNYITVPNNAVLDFTSTAFSAWAWVKPTSVASAQMLITHGATNADGWFMLLNAGTTSGRLFIRTNQAGANQSTQSVDDAIPAGQWSFLSFTRIGAAVTVYKNGVDNTTSPATHIDPVATARSLRIGIQDDLASNPFVGTFGCAGILNRGLTAQEHMQIYNATRWRYQ